MGLKTSFLTRATIPPIFDNLSVNILLRKETMSLQSDIRNVLEGMGKDLPDDASQSLFDTGVLDSLSILELVNALEDRFKIFFEEEDLTLENFATLTTIEHLISLRLGEQDS